jgi:hypothetical protein
MDLFMNLKKHKIKLLIVSAAIIIILILILLLIYLCSTQAGMKAEQINLDGHKSPAAKEEKKAEATIIEEKVPEKKPDARIPKKPSMAEAEKKEEVPQEKIVMCEISAMKNWQYTGIEVTPEKRIIIAYEKGKWDIGSLSFQKVDAEGYPSLNLSRPYPKIAIGALIGKIGNNKAFKVGNYCEINKSGISGELSLRINDDDGWLDDNRGSITVKIIIY